MAKVDETLRFVAFYTRRRIGTATSPQHLLPRKEPIDVYRPSEPEKATRPRRRPALRPRRRRPPPRPDPQGIDPTRGQASPALDRRLPAVPRTVSVPRSHRQPAGAVRHSADQPRRPSYGAALLSLGLHHSEDRG